MPRPRPGRVVQYGVWVCSACRRAQIADLRYSTSSCRHCSTRTALKDRRFYYEGEDDAEARRVVQRVAAQIASMPVEDYTQMLAVQERDRTGTLDDLIELLPAEFTPTDFATAARAAHVRGDPQTLLERLLAENRAFEPRNGKFRLLR